MKGDANDEAASDLLRCPARTGRALERQASHAKAGSSGSSTLRLWTPSQMRGLSSWAAHWVMGKRSSCSSWLPIVSKLSRPGSRMIRGRLRGCCTRPRSSAGKSFSRRASSERPHGRPFSLRIAWEMALTGQMCWASLGWGCYSIAPGISGLPRNALKALNCMSGWVSSGSNAISPLGAMISEKNMTFASLPSKAPSSLCSSLSNGHESMRRSIWGPSLPFSSSPSGSLCLDEPMGWVLSWPVWCMCCSFFHPCCCNAITASVSTRRYIARVLLQSLSLRISK